jgi:hypothetical protein
MGDYSLVKDETDTVAGLWVKTEAVAHDRDLLMALLAKHGGAASPAFPTLATGSVAVTPNAGRDHGRPFAEGS